MAYLTPDSVPEENTCRTILVPDSVTWDAIIYGALSELTKPYNWELFGSVTVDDAVAAAQIMLDAYVASICDTCDTCELVDGDLVLRLGVGGHVEQFIDGSWDTPEGVYEQPEVPPREETDDVDKRCNAAANVVNVYAELYEVTTDAATNFEFLDDFLDAVFQGIGEWIGIWAGDTAKAFSQLARQFSSQFFFIWESVTEDYWDAEFEDYFRCVLYEHSTVTGTGSVDFDYDAIRYQIAQDALNAVDVNRAFLVAQLEYLFYFTGAADGFNAAGGTTAIEDADCEDCVDVWCYTWQFHASSTLTPWTKSSNTAWSSLEGYKVNGLSSAPHFYDGLLNLTLPSGSYVVTKIEAELYAKPASGCSRYIFTSGGNTGNGGCGGVSTSTLNVTLDAGDTITVYFGSGGTGASPGGSYCRSITLYGTGDNPFGSDNCD